MSRDTAKAFYDKSGTDPTSGYITPDDAKGAIDTIYTDFAAADTAAIAAAIAGAVPRITGSPEGSRVGNPGDQVIQTDASARDVKGWLRWVKATGTGNTGWVAGPEADTGWRDITSALNAPFTTADPSTRVYLRRVGTWVEWVLANTDTFTPGTSSGTVNMWTIPSGFRSNIGSVGTGAIYHEVIARVRDGNGSLTGELWSAYNATHTLYGFSFVAGNQRRARMSHFTDNAWPSSLPGSAA